MYETSPKKIIHFSIIYIHPYIYNLYIYIYITGLSILYTRTAHTHQPTNQLIHIRRHLLRNNIRQSTGHILLLLLSLLDTEQHLLDADADLVGAGGLAQLVQRARELGLAVEGAHLAQHRCELLVRVDARHGELVVEDGLEVELAQNAAL